MSPRAPERGEVSITAVLVAMLLLVGALGATLGLFEGFIARASDSTRRTDAQDRARTAADAIARNLRNLADPTPIDPQVVERNTGQDLVFKTVDAVRPGGTLNDTNTKRVRYCLDPARRLLEQTQTWTLAATPPAPGTTDCPGSGWPSPRVAATDIVNTPAQPIFTYDNAALTDVAGIHVDLFVDTDLLRAPGATRLSTGVFLRNQNRRPTADFEATKQAGGLVLNGSKSKDPEGSILKYDWYDDGVLVGSGITFTYTGLAVGSVHQIQLKVSDPAHLEAVSAVKSVTA